MIVPCAQPRSRRVLTIKGGTIDIEGMVMLDLMFLISIDVVLRRVVELKPSSWDHL